jgi:predicted Fe-Mo cluster-binding NifX family protein
MIIAIPTAGGQLCPHFGHCEQFAFVTLDEADSAIAEIDYRTPPPHEPGVLPAWLAEQGATMIIAGGMGQRAQMLFDRNGISVVVGAPTAGPEDIVRAWIDETLETGQNLCDH